MKLPHASLSRAAALAVGALATAAPASAFEATGDPVADALMTLLEANGATDVAAEAATTSGGVTTITGLTATRTDEETDTAAVFTIDTITIEGGAVGTDSALEADRIDLETIRIAAEADPDGGPTNATIGSLTLTDVSMPQAAELADEDTTVDLARYRRMSLDDLAIAEADAEPVTVDGVEVEITRFDGEEPRAAVVEVDDITVPMGAIDDEDSRAQLEALGYDGVRLDFDADVDWEAASGALSVRKFELTGEDMGVISVVASLGGLTEAVIEQLQADQEDFQEMMAVLGNVTIGNLSISYDDGGLAPKLLDYTAEQQGTDTATLVAGLTAALPDMLAVLDNQAFQDQIERAVSAFLGNPQSLTVVAEPPAPVPVPQIAGVAMMAPQTLPSVLNVRVTANQ